MTARRATAERPRCRVVGVIASPADLNRAIRIRRPPDLFEVRLDCLANIVEQLETKLPRLRAPLIMTARHPREGGANKLSLRERRNLLSRFLPHAKYVDVELRTAFALDSLLRLAGQKKVRRIISFHNFKSTPSLPTLRTKEQAAERHAADIFKVATRTDTPLEVSRLLSFLTNRNIELPVSAMGIGKLGAISRVLLTRAGSALVYGSITRESNIEGQLSLGQLRDLGIVSRRYSSTR
jgi:3-dehydroquinate dehydratase-1